MRAWAQVMEEVRYSRQSASRVETGVARQRQLAAARLHDDVAKLREQLRQLKASAATEMRLVLRTATTSMQTVGTHAFALVQRERNNAAELHRQQTAALRAERDEARAAASPGVAQGGA
jgi:L-lactate utilization protein LutB